MCIQCFGSSSLLFKRDVNPPFSVTVFYTKDVTIVQPWKLCRIPPFNLVIHGKYGRVEKQLVHIIFIQAEKRMVRFTVSSRCPWRKHSFEAKLRVCRHSQIMHIVMFAIDDRLCIREARSAINFKTKQSPDENPL